MSFFVLIVVSVFAGMLGAMLGLGGGIIIIPMLTLGFGIPIQTAVATSLVAVIATSTGGAISYIRNNKTNIRLGMTLEVATSVGAIVAGFTIAYFSKENLTLLFIVILLYTTIHMFFAAIKKSSVGNKETGTEEQITDYKVKNMPLGLGLSFFAGLFSGYLGIGGGVVTVPTLSLFMGVPLKSATATSNFMIGVTAATGALIYFAKGNIMPDITVAVMVGVLIGANIGVKIGAKLKSNVLSYIFVVVLLITAGKMIIETFF